MLTLPQPDRDTIRVIGARSPFAPASERDIPAGSTLHDIVAETIAHSALIPHARVWLSDRAMDHEPALIAPDLWPRVRPKPGTAVSVIVVPAGGGGGGKSPLRTILMIAVMAAAAILGPMIGGVIFANLPLIGGLPLGLPFGVAQGLATALAGFATPQAGPLAVNLPQPLETNS